MSATASHTHPGMVKGNHEGLATPDSLTRQQTDGNQRARFDLATAYPSVDVAKSVISTIAAADQTVLRILSGELQGEANLKRLESDLCDASARVAGIPEQQRIRATISGSVAIDRCFRSLEAGAKADGYSGLAGVFLSPSVDIGPRLFLENRCNQAMFIPNLGGFEAELVNRVEGALDDLSRTHPDYRRLVFLTSPENPTGAILGRPEMDALVGCCASSDTALVVDHCFLFAGVHEPETVARLWDFDRPDVVLIAIWDTGKTIATGGDKAAFIVTNSAVADEQLEDSISSIQYAPNLRSMLIHRDLFVNGSFDVARRNLRDACIQNAEMLRQVLGARFKLPNGGSNAWVRCELSASETRLRLLERGVSSISGDVFLPAYSDSSVHIRVALSRRPEHFSSALDDIAGVLLPN